LAFTSLFLTALAFFGISSGLTSGMVAIISSGISSNRLWLASITSSTWLWVTLTSGSIGLWLDCPSAAALEVALLWSAAALLWSVAALPWLTLVEVALPFGGFLYNIYNWK
jgi:hypothetical protein